MFKCTKCGKESKFENGLCPKCYAASKTNGDEANGLTEKEHNYRYNMIKGRIRIA